MTDPSPVAYSLEGSIATVVMDDGKANVMSLPMLEGLAKAFDRAEADGAVVLLTGREGMFSGGYDLGMFRDASADVVRTVRAGGELLWRILGFPRPVVAACTGHAVAQGAFLLLAADVRIGAAGDFKIGLSEVAIGLTIPLYGVELARARLTAPWFHHATVTGTLYPPRVAREAGFLERIVEASTVLESAGEAARRLTTIDMSAHAATKQRVRAPLLTKMRQVIDEEMGSA